MKKCSYTVNGVVTKFSVGDSEEFNISKYVYVVLKLYCEELEARHTRKESHFRYRTYCAANMVA